MDIKKEKLLDAAYETLIKVALKGDALSEMHGLIDDNFMGYGSAPDEKLIGMEGFRWMVERQWKEMAIENTEIKRHSVKKEIFAQEKAALLMEEMEMIVSDGNDITNIDFRLSTLLGYSQNKWTIIHFHFSVPDVNTPEGAAWPIEELKLRNAELENLVAKKTADLVERNRELEIEASLERVRGKAMAMQKPEELVEVAQILRTEMGGLGVEELETSSIYIHDETTQKTECWYAIQQEKKLVADHMTIDLSDTVVGRQMLQFYHSDKKEISIIMKGAARKEWINFCAEHSKLLEGFYGDDIPDRTYHLYKFSNGYMGAASPGDISTESWDLLKRATRVFSLAYTRFSDLQKAESQAEQARQHLIQLQAEKNRAESAFIELKSTQTQLIQSEKMASLGELTAGIAHEIQNPLNFVNNFSEVSNELVDEMNEELDKGDIKEAKAIASDIKQNLDKINHHGKRADAIVKGMLQHSRISSGQKEPVDINALADEYLRLSYHGLRAKDPQDAVHNSFNAIMETHFDSSIGKINMVGQDIGRVLLNLFNNAFYSVNEKKKRPPDPRWGDYEPTVYVSTEKQGDHILIKVKDNGIGIPEEVVQKIYQPFFTTKPTGEGTGLGLSLSYDIVKAHGGEMKVETKEGEGATFIIQLPKNIL